MFCNDRADAMPELPDRCSERRHDVTTDAARRDESGSQVDEFVLGFRDCADESLRFLAASTRPGPDEAAGTPGGRGLVDALRVHLVEHEEETLRRQRRRRRPSPHDDNEPGGACAASAGLVDERQSSTHPPRHRRRLHSTTASKQRRRSRHSRALQCSPEDVLQTVHSRCGEGDDHLSAVSRKASDRVNTSGDSGYDGDFASSDNTAADDELGRGNVDQLRHYADELSQLARRDIRVGQLLNELFQLMDSDVDDA